MVAGLRVRFPDEVLSCVTMLRGVCVRGSERFGLCCARFLGISAGLFNLLAYWISFWFLVLFVFWMCLGQVVMSAGNGHWVRLPVL